MLYIKPTTYFFFLEDSSQGTEPLLFAAGLDLMGPMGKVLPKKVFPE